MVCLDTLGQDREFTDAQRRFVLETIANFRRMWEDKERENLRKDRDRRISQLMLEKEVTEAGETARANEEEDKQVEEILTARETEQSFADEDLRELNGKMIKIQALSKVFKEKEEWKKGLLELREQTVLKLPRILQSVFYLLQYQREDVCQEGTNKFFWKRAKRLLNDAFIDKLCGYTVLGVKPQQQAQYTTLNFLERNLDGLTQEQVDQECGMHIGRLFKWLQLCIRTRKDDIIYRKAQRKKAMLSRDSLIQREKERQLRQE